MIDKLIKLADYFDKKGLIKEADELDKIIKESSMCMPFIFGAINKLIGCSTLSESEFGCPQFKISSRESFDGIPIYNKLEYTDARDTGGIQAYIMNEDIKFSEDGSQGYVDIKFSNITDKRCTAVNWDGSENDNDSAYLVVRFYCKVYDKPLAAQSISSSKTTVLEGVNTFEGDSGDNEKITFESDTKWISWQLPEYGMEGKVWPINSQTAHIIAGGLERIEE